MRIPVVVFFTLILTMRVEAQTCSQLEKERYKIPIDIPPEHLDQINCVDYTGQKQGYWILYPFDSASVVEWYTIGRYFNDEKVGVWATVQNTHNVYVSKTTEYIRSQDSVGIIVIDKPLRYSIMYSTDSTSIKARCWNQEFSAPFVAECTSNDTLNICKLSYLNQKLSKFPSKQLKSRLISAFGQYEREIQKHNEAIR